MINVLEEEKLPDQAKKNGLYLKSRLEELGIYCIVREVRGKGILLGVEIVEDAGANKPFPRDRSFGEALKRTALKNGIILRIDHDWFAVAPPLIATNTQLDEMCNLINKSVREALDMIAVKT